jgi:hypothetical protein
MKQFQTEKQIKQEAKHFKELKIHLSILAFLKSSIHNG